MNTLGPDFDTLLTRGALCGLALAGSWVVLVMAAVAVEAWTQGRIGYAARTGCPVAVRIWLLGVFVALFAGLAPANASDHGTGAGGSDGGARPEVTSALDGLPLPDRTSGGDRRVVAVRPGDSLWSITRDRFPGGHDDAVLAAATARLYSANRAVIGPDPDLIRPGQKLTLPEEA